MSGLEILGVAASAVHIAQVSLAIVTSLTGLFNQVRDAPKIVQTRLVQVQTLAEITRLIASMSQLQTAEVGAILESCSKDAEVLKAILQGLVTEKHKSSFPMKKWIQVIDGILAEDQIVGLLYSLEVGKSALTLCIARIDSTLLQDIDNRLEIMRRDLKNVAQNVNEEIPRLRTAIEYLTDQYQDFQTKDASMSEKTTACLRSLSAIDQGPIVSQMLNRSKQAGEWILENPKYVSWLENKEADILWITAKAGCGKTTLASHITQMVQANPSSRSSNNNDPKPVILFFFFRKSNLEAEGTAIGALRTIISQLASQIPNVLPIILDRYEFLSAKGTFEWSWENLLAMIRNILEEVLINLEVYVILDALDECEPESRRRLLDWLQEVVDNGKRSSTSKTSRSSLKFAITSRPDANIFDRLSHFQAIEMTALDTATDMHILINNRIKDFSRRRHLDNEASQRIIDFLEENAHGMFLWVVLIIQDLERRDERLTEEVITAKLLSTPLTLINTYEAILCNTPPTRKKDMWSIFRWLLFARRGLTLAELEVALCLETGVPRWYDFAGDVNFLCGSFVRFDGPRGEINLIHQTARTFLEVYAKTADFEDVTGVTMNSMEANAHLAEICVQYIIKNEDLTELVRPRLLGKSASDYKSIVEGFLSHHPFLCYAIEGWASHLRAVGSPSATLFQLALVLLASDERRDSIMQLTYFINHQGNASVPLHQHPIHLAAYFNLPWLVDFYISQDRRAISALSSMNDTPLIWASEKGSTACVKILLDAGAEPNKFEYDGWSALHWAARNDHVEIVRLLIDHGAILDPQDDKGHTPLEWAADREHWEIFDVLEGRLGERELGKADKIMSKPFSMRNKEATLGFMNLGQFSDYRP